MSDQDQPEETPADQGQGDQQQGDQQQGPDGAGDGAVVGAPAPTSTEAGPDDERIARIGERIDKARSQAEDAGVLVDEDEGHFADSGVTDDEDDQTIAPPG